MISKLCFVEALAEKSEGQVTPATRGRKGHARFPDGAIPSIRLALCISYYNSVICSSSILDIDTKVTKV